MGYVVWSKKYGPVAKIDGPMGGISLREAEIAIPCEAEADVNDMERWERESAAMEGKYAPTLESARERKREELMGVRDQLIAAGFDWNGHHYPLSPELSGDMLIKLTAMQMLPPPSDYVYQWKDSDGIYRSIGNTDDFKVFCAGALSHGEALFARERMLQELVGAAESIEAVEAITWETVPQG